MFIPFRNFLFRNLLILISVHNLCSTQPDLKFLPFDWMQFRSSGKVTSISFNEQYAFIGTQYGGVQRFHLFSEQFNEPITRAQGLRSNFITAVHSADNGVLWLATSLGVELSFDGIGNWNFLDNDNFGFYANQTVERIGESENFIWLDLGTVVHQLDPLTGIQLGIMANPAEPVRWSSGTARFKLDLSSLLTDYSILGGWITDLSSLYNPDGSQIGISTFTINKMNEIWLGTEDGTFFRGDPTMKILAPYKPNMVQTNIQVIAGGDSFWLGGLLENSTFGITRFDPDNFSSKAYVFKDIINMDPMSIYSILKLDEEIWFGGNDGLLIYNQKEDFWRNYGLMLGGTRNWITKMIEFNGQVLIGSPYGLKVINIKNKQPIDNDLVKRFRNILIHDIAIIENLIFIATETGLFIFDHENDRLYNGESFGYKSKNFIYPIRFSEFTAITQYEKNLYIGNRGNVIKFNLEDREWFNAVDASIYGGLSITNMVVDKETIFIATVNGVINYDMEKNFLKDIYNYPFIGEVNDMYIRDNKIWMGTSQGLISYEFK